MSAAQALAMYRANNSPVRSIVVWWIDEATVIAKAKESGWQEGESLADYVNDLNDYDKTKVGFSSVTKAKAWAVRNKRLDVYNSPEVLVYEWPNYRKFPWERECIRHLRYCHPGRGWEEMGDQHDQG